MKTKKEIEAEMRKQCPEMFNHPGLRPDEVWLGDQIIEIVFVNAHEYRQAGLKSVRVGDEDVLVKTSCYSAPGEVANAVVREFSGRSIFVFLDDLLDFIERKERETVQKPGV
jgi:hypothetical protein